jgi:hypothetical protein
VQPAIEGLCALMSKCRQVSPHCRRRHGNNPVISAAGEPLPTAPPPPAPAASDRAPNSHRFHLAQVSPMFLNEYRPPPRAACAYGTVNLLVCN